MFTTEVHTGMESLIAQLASNTQHNKDNEEWCEERPLYRINACLLHVRCVFVAIKDKSLRSPWKVAFKPQI